MDVNYRELEGINQSSLKKILEHPKAYLEALNSKSNSLHFVEGSLFDAMVEISNNPNLDFNTELHNRFHFTDSLPKPGVVEVLDHIFDLTRSSESSNLPVSIDSDEFILSICNKLNYQSNWKDATRVKKIKDNLDYFRILESGKIICPTNSYDKCLLSLNHLQECDHLDYIFNSEYRMDKVVIQFKVKIKGVTYLCKAELDLILIDHDQMIIAPFDIKTTSKPIHEFRNDFWNLRYDFQSAFYIKALKKAFPGYHIEPFTFIVIEFGNPDPMQYEVSEGAIDIAINGGYVRGKGEKEGIKKAWERLAFHTNEDKWAYNMEYYTDYKAIL